MYIPHVFLSHTPLTMPVRIHPDPDTPVLEKMCRGTRALLHMPSSPSLCLPAYVSCM